MKSSSLNLHIGLSRVKGNGVPPTILGETAIPLHPPDTRNSSREKLALRALKAQQGIDMNKA